MDAIEGIVRASDAHHLILGTGRDAPDPREAGLEAFPTTTVEALAADPDDTFPADWEAQVGGLGATRHPMRSGSWSSPRARPARPKGVMLGHDNVTASIRTFHEIVPRMEHRIVSLLPLSHLLEQSVGLFYALSVGADILYVRSRNPRVIFEALRSHRVTSLIVVPQVLDLFWSAIEREVEKRGRTSSFNSLRAFARRLPVWLRRRLFGSVHAQLGGEFRLFLSAGAFLPPASSRPGRTSASRSSRATAPPRPGTGTCTTLDDHVPGTVGRPPTGIELRIADDGEVQFKGPTLFHGYWNAPEKTAEALHRRRLVPDRRHRPSRRRRAAHPVGPEQGHHRPAQRLQRLSRGHRERPARRRHPRLGRPRDEPGPDRGGHPGRRRTRRRGRGRRRADARPRDRCRRPRPDRCRRQGGQRDARAEPADRRLAGSGPRRTSRGRTRSRSSATGSGRGRRWRHRCPWQTAAPSADAPSSGPGTDPDVSSAGLRSRAIRSSGELGGDQV